MGIVFNFGFHNRELISAYTYVHFIVFLLKFRLIKNNFLFLETYIIISHSLVDFLEVDEHFRISLKYGGPFS